MKQVAHDLILRELASGFRPEQAELDDAPAYGFDVDPLAVVGDREAKRAADQVRIDPDQTFARLAGTHAFVRRLDPVIERIAEEVDHRFGDRVEHGTVDLDSFAFDLQAHVLGQLAGEAAHGARVAVEQHPDRDHPHVARDRLEHRGRAADLAAVVPEHRLHPAEDLAELGVDLLFVRGARAAARGERDLPCLAELAEEAARSGMEQEQIADDLADLLEPLGRDPDAVGRERGA